jgi:lysozyme
MMRIIKASANCTDLIKRFEGLSLKPYLCPANVPTIGYGSTLYANGARVRMTDRPLSQQQADVLLNHEVAKFAKIVDSMTRDDVSQNQFDALVSFCFNVGGGALKSSTLLRKVNANLNDPTIRAEFLRWNKAAGRVLKGLTTRREAEANLYFK